MDGTGARPATVPAIGGGFFVAGWDLSLSCWAGLVIDRSREVLDADIKAAISLAEFH